MRNVRAAFAVCGHFPEKEKAYSTDPWSDQAEPVYSGNTVLQGLLKSVRICQSPEKKELLTEAIPEQAKPGADFALEEFWEISGVR